MERFKIRDKRNTLTKTERKHLVWLKMKNKGMSYEEACKELEGELNYLNKQIAKKTKETKQTNNFNEEFERLKNINN